MEINVKQETECKSVGRLLTKILKIQGLGGTSPVPRIAVGAQSGPSGRYPVDPATALGRVTHGFFAGFNRVGGK